jgi:magnesium transporter
VRETVKPTDSTGLMAYRLVDEIAERYLTLVDDLDAEIDELEDLVEEQAPELTRTPHLRPPPRPAPHPPDARADARRGADVTDGAQVFPHAVEIAFNGAYDKLLRALDGLELSRDLLAGVRDYNASKIANDQNEVMKRLTVVASLLLVPTFIVGLYGQNFHDIPELRWGFGYGYVWGLIVVTTLLQLWYFRRKRWL